jgi:uncharacterized protein YlxP (DUF503 family)
MWVHMVIGVLQLDLRLHGPQSLKQKRSVIQKVLARCRNRFPASCAEVGHQDLWQRTLLGFAVISSSEQVVAPILTRIEDEVLASGELDLVNADTEIIHY